MILACNLDINHRQRHSDYCKQEKLLSGNNFMSDQQIELPE